MAQKTYKQIQDEADRMFGRGASQQKFEWRRAQQAAAGLEQEKKTRGGVAGAYDRNKKLVSAAATAAGFLMGGPAGAGLARGAVQGLDRPGQGGIGFDVKRGVKGFAEGYGAGNIARMGQAGLQRLFAAGAPSAGAAAGAAGAVPRVGLTDAELMREFSSAGTQAAGGAGRLGNLAAAAGRGIGRVTDYLGKRPEILGQGLMAGAQARTAAANRELEREALAQREAQFQQTFKQSEDERQREMERQRRIAELLAPVFQRVAGGQG